jgi:hypothetical protein
MRHPLDNLRKRTRVGAWAMWLLTVSATVVLLVTLPLAPEATWGLIAAAVYVSTWGFLWRRKPLKIPVLNYHSVSAAPDWLGIPDRVSISPALFRRQLEYLRRHRYETLFVSELHALRSEQTPIDPKARYVALTFDDGYADNWVAVFPLLREFGIKATVFVSADFVDRRDDVRPQARDAVSDEDLEWEGYLSWPELRAMRESGLVEIQAHGSAHTRVFGSERLKGFVSLSRPNPWLFWNEQPELKTDWWRAIATDRSLWGHPVYAQGPALTTRAYRPDAQAVERLLAWTRAQGSDLFEEPRWSERIEVAWRECQPGPGTWESQEEYVVRVKNDLRHARTMLEQHLGAEVRFLCWPENAVTPEAERIALRNGYLATVANGHNVLNRIGHNTHRITRIFVGSCVAGVKHEGIDYLGFVLQLRIFEGAYLWLPPMLLAGLVRKLHQARNTETCHDYFSVWG